MPCKGEECCDEVRHTDFDNPLKPMENGYSDNHHSPQSEEHPIQSPVKPLTNGNSQDSSRQIFVSYWGF
jgi:hypothetical protein